MNEFQIRASYIFAKARLLVGDGIFMLFPGSLIAVGKLYPRIERIANDNEAETMSELTKEEKAEAKKILDALMEYLWSRVMIKVNAGTPMEHAIIELMQEITNEAKT